ncbi:MAG TPA: AMP-binding protein [Nitrospiraceae bacterium]|jgi:acyl-coenzyme A synthetase/AMP-(fatty) acid ligase|nr:AMP-binding protein [Nitrospiraceae bacterium]
MNTAALLGLYHTDRVLAWENGHPITYGHFLSDVGALVDLLPERPTVINLADDRYRFLVGFAAALVRGQTTLLPPSRAPGALAQLVREYGSSYCLVDGTEQVEQLPSYQIPKGTGSPTDKAKVPQIPIDHPALVAFTSGSTGSPHPHSKTWGSLVAVARSTGTRLGLKTSDQMTVVATVPHQHMYGIEASMMLPIQHGMAFHVGRPLFPEDVRLALADVPSPRMLVTTPLHIRACVTARSRLPPVECILSATATLPSSLAKQAETLFQTSVYEVYGFTEAGSIATRRTVAEDTWHVLDGITLHQESAGCSLQAPYLRGPIPFPDLVSLLGPHRFVLHGRGTDLVNIGGHRGSLSDLNQKLNEIEGVQDGTFFLPDEMGTSVTRLIAFAVAPGKAAEHILSALRTVIDPVFLPRPLHLVSHLPRNETGKLTREALLGLLQEHHKEERHGT